MKLFTNVTNEALAKIGSFEFVSGMVVAVFLAGVIWTNLNAGLAVAQDAAIENKQSLEVVKEDVEKIKTDVALIRQSQDIYQKTQKEADAESKEDLREIKNLLMGPRRD